MTLKLHNKRYYPLVFLVGAISAAAVWFVFDVQHRPELLLTAVGAVAAFTHFLYRQNLDNTTLFKDLFSSFNARYDKLNADLNRITTESANTKLVEPDRSRVFDYFNLCAEEHFFHEAGCIDEKVWRSWHNGMVTFFNVPGIRDLWNNECATDGAGSSYYGFKPPPYEGQSLAAGESVQAQPADEVRIVALPAIEGGGLAAAPATQTRFGETRRAGTTEPNFSVQAHFPYAPRSSVEWSQKYVDAALSYEGVRAFVNGAGIGFEPNFVFIERVYTEDSGFAASFFGTTGDFAKYRQTMRPGRNASYSRLYIHDERTVADALKCLHISANLKNLERC